MNAEEFDRRFDDGEDLDDYIDWSSARRPNLEAEKVELELPHWVVDSLDRHARIAGVSRTALVRLWLAERLQQSFGPPVAAE